VTRSLRLVRLMRSGGGRLVRDSFYRNSILLILDTFVLGAVGFLFWLVGARLYTQFEVGITATLIASASLLATGSQLGFDSSFIRYLHGHANPAALIDTGLTVVTATAIVLTAGFIFLYVPGVHALRFLTSGPFDLVWFGAFVVASALNGVTNGIFLGRRKAQLVLYANLPLNLCKLALPWFLAAYFTLGLYFAVGVGMMAAAATSFLIILRSEGHFPRPRLAKAEITMVGGFSSITYLSTLIQSTPQLVLPLILTSQVGPSPSAIFYLALTASNLVYIIPTATATTLFAEGSAQHASLHTDIKRALALTVVLLAPVLVVAVPLSGPIMSLFGATYGLAGGLTFRLLLGAAAFLAVNYLAIAILKVLKLVRYILLVNLVGAAFIIGGAILFGRHGPAAIAAVWLVGQGLTAALYLAVLGAICVRKSRPRYSDT
jgi:O-antigen/teichoic acid export membrane protein